MSKVLIAGCGFVGERVAELFLDRGAEVFTLSRSLAHVPSGAHALRADLRDPEQLRDLPNDLTRIVFCAGADAHTEAAYRETYVDASRHLLEALAPNGAKPAGQRYLFVSSTAVYEDLSGDWVNEETPTTPQRFPGRVLLEAEALVRELAPSSVVLRAAGIYGPGRASLVDAVRRGEARYAAGPPSFTNRIHREDCAAAIVHLLEASSTGGTYIAADDSPADRREVLEWLASRLGAPRPRPASAGEVRARGGNKRCSNARLRASGFELRFPSFRDGYGHDLALTP